MKMKISLFTCSAMFTLLLLSCRNQQQREGQPLVLDKPPYAPITDSIRLFPGNADLYLHRAELLSKNNLHEIASPDFQKAWQLHPTEETGFRYASNLAILSSMEEEVALLKDCIRKFPDNPSFKRLLGDSYSQGGHTKDALNLYETILKTDSLDFETWFEKGLLLAQTGDSAGAMEAVKKAWTIQPVNTYALQLASMYAEAKNPDVLTICNGLLKKDTLNEMTDPLLIKGIYYSNIAKYPEAIIQFDSCIHRDWKTTDAYIEKGIVFYKQEKYNEALPVFQMATTVSNTSADAWYWMGRCYESMGKKADAITNYERALSLDRNIPEARAGIRRLSK